MAKDDDGAFAAAIILGVIGLIALLSRTNKKKCGYCGGENEKTDIICKYCGQRI